MKCALCSEEINTPYFFEDKIFGSTCIKIVNPLARRPKLKKEFWVQAVSYTSEVLINGKTKIIAKYKGFYSKERDFIGFCPSVFRQPIFIQDDKAFINLMAYDKGISHINLELLNA